MKIWHISDTHGYHDLLKIPEDIDCVILSGDASNSRNPYNNEVELRKFITWFDSLPIKHKIFVPGNHETSIEKGLITRDNFEQSCIHYLFNESVNIEGIRIWGSPHTPSFGNWAFMKARHKLHSLWESIPDNTDIVVCHTPPKGILDLSFDRNHNLEFCGCSALAKRITTLNPKLFLCGHIHNMEGVINAGTRQLKEGGTLYSNGSVVTDNKFGKLTSNGNILNI